MKIYTPQQLAIASKILQGFGVPGPHSKAEQGQVVDSWQEFINASRSLPTALDVLNRAGDKTYRACQNAANKIKAIRKANSH
ncbi:hypothetical protein [Leptolyngbya sp. FACHB-261]|uniref:hypothetical protein n=1 Tax=Leptolyngbya sp. FACHB-261 TaxID=2692806 RepID=UPI0016896B08|nr:hypothetical protein [Leptolyngbya sp. FACHB-261]MBD2103817.1 hypothetical protein [Leptolyngbya sp. FACHB-261]